MIRIIVWMVLIKKHRYIYTYNYIYIHTYIYICICVDALNDGSRSGVYSMVYSESGSAVGAYLFWWSVYSKTHKVGNRIKAK